MSESSRKHPTVKTEFIAIADAYPSQKKHLNTSLKVSKILSQSTLFKC